MKTKSIKARNPLKGKHTEERLLQYLEQFPVELLEAAYRILEAQERLHSPSNGRRVPFS